MSISSVIEQLRTRTRAMKVREVADLLNLDPRHNCPVRQRAKSPGVQSRITLAVRPTRTRSVD